MLGLDPTLDIPATARYHREAVEQIIQSVEEGVYCALLGPRLSGKTLLLRYIERNLAKLLGWTCAYIDLLEVRTNTQQAFFADLTRLTAQQLGEVTGREVPVSADPVASSAVFRAFLSECLEITGRDLVLIFDPLEALPTDLVQALLTSLRAAYMDQQPLDHQVTVVVSGALSLATVAVGESSPFRGVANRVFVGDLSARDSQELILELLDKFGVSPTKQAVQKLLHATSGDIYLIHHLTQCCAELVGARSSKQLRSRDIHYLIDRFLRQEVFRYAPLVEAVRLIEEDPDLLHCILQLLEQESVPRAALALPLSPDLDPLYLTGVIERTDGDHYRLQNLIYRRFLSRHFTPGRVGHVLAMSGRWDSAIDYLESSILQGHQQFRTDLLPAAINSMYASQDLPQAVHFLRRGLAAAFGVRDSQIWFSPPQEKVLRLIGPAEPDLLGEAWANLQISQSADRLEARAYRQQVPLRGQEGERRVVRAIPLLIPGSKPIGVATIYDDLTEDSFTELRERDLQLAGFLNQAARALQTVGLRRQELALAGRVQASLLPDVPPLPRWQIVTTWRPARETSGDFYDFISLPGGRLGIVIADVVDKGMGAALLMTLSRTLIRTYAGDSPDQPERLMSIVNQRILADLDAGLFVTLFYGVLDPATGELVYCNAGHPPPYLAIQGEGSTVEALHKTGIPLGIAEDSTWTPASVQLPPSGMLLLYTDGILDAQNPHGEFFGQEQILKIIQDHSGRTAQEIRDALVAAVYAFAGPEPQVDDITLMVLLRDPPAVPPFP
ncbi:MAG TPA: PP2C family protein-serine/threonine phosphatase [Anaerolineales bacterium]